MKLFISWSGQQSAVVASALRSWIPRVLQAVEPWLSSADIESGARWSPAIEEQLLECKAGIICVTRENIQEPWLMFEAGALSKVVGRTMVCPYLVDLEPADLKPPLGLFQARRSNREETFKLMETINGTLGEKSLQPDALRETFDVWWDRLAPKLTSALTPTPAAALPARKIEDMMAEALELLRAQERRANEPQTGVASALRHLAQQRAQDYLLPFATNAEALRRGMSAVAEWDTLSGPDSTIPGVGRLARERFEKSERDTSSDVCA